MSKYLRLTDLYASVQGEGPRTGVPTTFIRFGGCNMRCAKWPCDTPYAIEPKQWRNDPTHTVDEIMELLLHKRYCYNVCITGGEPTMQPESLLRDLVETLTNDHRTIDLFTNGSLKPFPAWVTYPNVTVIMDWKLSGSGEGDTGLNIRMENVKYLQSKDMIKFVITGENDFEEAIEAWRTIESVHTGMQFSAGVAWQHMTERELLEKILVHGLPWRLNMQIHKYIFDPAERQI